MGLTRITERVNLAGSRVDRSKGIIKNVRICGPSSKNGSDYSRASFGGNAGLYEGRPIYANHSKDRRIEDKLGWFENVSFDQSGLPRGDFHLLTTHPMAPAILEAAERRPELFGFSHVALCKTSRGSGGRQKVEAVERVESIDLVAEPATTAGLFESVHRDPNLFADLMSALSPTPTHRTTPTPTPRKPMSTLREVMQRHVPGAARRRFAEAVGDLLDTPAGSPGYGSADQEVTAAIAAAGAAIWKAFLDGTDTIDAALTKLRRLGKAVAVVIETPDDDTGDDDDPILGTPTAATEGRKGGFKFDKRRGQLVLESLDAGPSLTDGPLGWDLGAAPGRKPSYDAKAGRLTWR